MTPSLAILAAVLLPPSEDLPREVKLPPVFSAQGKAAKLNTNQPVVVIYLTTECPIANRYAPVIETIKQDFGGKLTLLRGYPLGKSEERSVQIHAREYKHTSGYFLDPNLAFAKALGLRVSPEAVLIDAKSNVIYRGRIDGRNVEHGKETKNYRHDLREAIKEHLAGKPISEATTQAQGCFLTFDN